MHDGRSNRCLMKGMGSGSIYPGGAGGYVFGWYATLLGSFLLLNMISVYHIVPHHIIVHLRSRETRSVFGVR